LAGVAALALLSGCVIRDDYDDGYGGRYAGNNGYGGAYGRNYGYGGYASDPYEGYGGYGGYGSYGYPNYDYYATPFTTFGLGLGLGYYDFGGFPYRRGYGGYYGGGNGGGGFRGGSRSGGGERGGFRRR
jgi:squid-like protein